jgi:hypothetical protein
LQKPLYPSASPMSEVAARSSPDCRVDRSGRTTPRCSHEIFCPYFSAWRMTSPVMSLAGTVPPERQRMRQLASAHVGSHAPRSCSLPKRDRLCDRALLWASGPRNLREVRTSRTHRLSTDSSCVNILKPGLRTPMIPSSSPMPASSAGVALTWNQPSFRRSSSADAPPKPDLPFYHMS